MEKEIFRIGVISDTHGLLRKEAEKQLKLSNVIIHAGDIGNVEIINRLQKIAPVYFIKGNIDKEDWAAEFPEILELKIADKNILVIHNLKDSKGSSKCYDIIISGHSHQPLIKQENGIFYLNPGSAGKRRFSLPVSVAEILIAEGKISARIIELDI